MTGQMYNQLINRTVQIVIFLIVLINVFYLEAKESDVERNGLVIGIGVGAGVTYFQYKIVNSEGNLAEDDDVKLSSLLDLKFGYGITDNFLVYYNFKLNMYKWENENNESVNLHYLTNSLGVTYFFNNIVPSVFIKGGIGIGKYEYLSTVENHGDVERTHRGYNGYLGFGYEFGGMFTIDLDFIYSKMEEQEYKRNDIMNSSSLFLS